jgi:hypothetical protein
MKAAREEILKEIRRQADEEVSNKRKYNAEPDESVPEFKQSTGDEGEFYKENMGLLKALSAIYDVGKTIVKEGTMPEYIWDSGSRSGSKDGEKATDYNNSPFHIPTPLAGGTDQIVEEATEAVQLVKTGYEFIRHPKKTFQGLWESVKSIDADKIKKMAKSLSGVENYQAGGDRARYQGGKHGVQVAMIVVTGLKALTKGTEIVSNGSREIKKLDDFVIGSKADEIGSVIDNARANKIEIKNVGEDKLITTNVENGQTKIKVIEKNGNDADVQHFEHDDLTDHRGEGPTGDIDEVESSMQETTFDNPVPVGNVITTKGGSKGNWNKDLNLPTDNKVYKVDNNFEFKTNGAGLVEQVDVAELKIDIQRDRNFYQQKKAKNSGGNPGSDDGGHLIGSRFNGPGEKINIVPMDRGINRSGGAWYKMESEWASYLKNPDNKIKNVKINIVYNGNRPASFNISWKQIDANGVEKVMSKTINN